MPDQAAVIYQRHIISCGIRPFVIRFEDLTMKTPPALARDIMVTRLVTLSPNMDVFEAVEQLLNYRISGAPVVDTEGNFLGVFSERCCMSVMVQGAYEQLPNTTVAAFMDSEADTIDEDTDLLSIAQRFLNTSRRRLPVVRGKMLVGQISRRDILKTARELFKQTDGPTWGSLWLSSTRPREEAPIS